MRACNVDETATHGSGDPWEVFTQLVILIIEGRVPGGEKGFHEGPHCSLPHQTGISRHVCNPNTPMCARAESLLRQLRLMWGVGVGVSVEVLVAPECEHGAAFTSTLDTTTAPSPQLRLIEQWNFTVYDHNLPDAMPSGWTLVAAVRSFLHFSQLSAWFSASGGARPPNVLYRLSVTSPVFCSKFEAGSEEQHTFPVANVGQETAIKVVVRSLPRSSQAPVVSCNEVHLKAEDPSSSFVSLPSTSSSSQIYCSDSSFSSQQQQNSSKSEGNGKDEEDLRRSMMRARLGDPTRASRSESPDTQLGESLLDPPNSLSRIPRRFQSPSRSGSPSLETPEHIICRVRHPGPSHGRPPDVASFCQPLVIPARQPLSTFAWTQTRYPSTQQQHQTPQQPPYPSQHHPSFHPHQVHSEIFQGSRASVEALHESPRLNTRSMSYPAFASPGPHCFYTAGSQLVWAEREGESPYDQPPLPSTYSHPFQIMQPHSVSHAEEKHITCDQAQTHSKFLQNICSQQDFQCQQQEQQQNQYKPLQQQLHQEKPYSRHVPQPQAGHVDYEPRHLLKQQILIRPQEYCQGFHKDEEKQSAQQQRQDKSENDEQRVYKDLSYVTSSSNEQYLMEFARYHPDVSSTSPFAESAEELENLRTAINFCHSDISKDISCTDELAVVSPSKSREPQGTKRKGAYTKESPRTKRESPPHVYYSREGKEEGIREEAKGHEELRKRKTSGEDDEEEEICSRRKSCSTKRTIVTDQLWPSCSQPGKHLCSSVEDLSEMAARDHSNFMPINKSLRKEKRSCKMFESCNGKVSFDLTPRETQEVLRVLRQNTPVPPLRIKQHRTGNQNSTVESCYLSKAGRLESDKRSERVQLLEKSGKILGYDRTEDTSCFKSSKERLQAKGKGLKCPQHGVSRAETEPECKFKGNTCPTSSNNPCDTSFKDHIKCTCDRIKNAINIDPTEDDSDDEVLDGLSLSEIENMKGLQPNLKSSCIEARTVTQKTNYFTVKSQPTSKPNTMLKQTSQALGKSPLTSVLSGIKEETKPCTKENKGESLGKARRALTFEQSPSAAPKVELTGHIDVESSKKSLSEHSSESSCDEKKANADFVKRVTILKHLMKKPYLSDEKEFERRRKSLLEKKQSPMEIDSGEEDSEEPSVNGYKRPSLDLEEKELNEEDQEVEDLCKANKGVPIPSTSETVKFRRSLDSAATLVFHNKTGLPLTSSPAPLRKGTCFDFDSSLNSIAGIRSAFRPCDDVEEENDNFFKDISSATPTAHSTTSSLSAPITVTCSNLLGSFEECVLNGRLEPVSTVQGFNAEIAASGAFCPKHISKPVAVFFYTLCDNDQISSPYMGHINLGKKGYQIPNQGTVQVTLFNPHGTVVKMFVVVYDLSDMPPNSKTFLRQRTLNMPVGETDTHPDAHQWLRYLIHLRFASSKSGKVYLHTDIRMLIFRKSDADAATLHKNSFPFELRSFTHGPTNPKFSPRK